MTPSVSIVINTLNRAESLRRTLASLRSLDYPEFEVVVVVGQSIDHTDAVIAEFGGAIKVARCLTPNLSESRNLGIRHASGDLVAFIDDDAVPDPWWLHDIADAFEDPEVGAAGGPVYDHDGSLFSKYVLADAHGDLSFAKDGTNPSRIVAAPCSSLVTTPVGTNSVFRLNALLEIGGFDEEFEYYLEETEVSRRLVDAGWVIEACDSGFVQHQREPSAVRGADRVQRDHYPILKNRLYFALRHARPRAGLLEVVRRYEAFVDQQRQYRRWCLAAGLLEIDDVEAFERDVVRAVDKAYEAVQHRPKLRPRAWFEETPAPFTPFVRAHATCRLHICIVTQEYLPRQLNGIARLSHELATALAARGHVIRILTEGDDQDRVTFEEGVWVHRVAARPVSPPVGVQAPARIWNFSSSVERELRRIDANRAVDIVHVPNWNSEGMAVLEDPAFRTVLGLHTTLATVARIDSRINPRNSEIAALLALERRCYEQATGFLACGPASVKQVEIDYGIELPRERIGLVPFGIPDLRNCDPIRIPDRVNVLFVGRLEARKGIDTLLEAAAVLLPEIPDVVFTIVGNDSLLGESGQTYRDVFERSVDLSLRHDRVAFRGVAPDDELGRYYAGCDVFVAPSRSESFGLIVLEAMREGKPVIAGDVGGMREVVEHEGNGLLVTPSDPHALADALRRLVSSASLREAYGRRSRTLFVERFTAERMAEGYERFCTELIEADSASAPEFEGTSTSASTSGATV